MNVSYEIAPQELSVELLPAREALSAPNISEIAAHNTQAAVHHGKGGEVNAQANQKIDVPQKAK